MTDDERPDDDEALDAALTRAVGSAMARRGELPPITADEVRAAESAGIAFEGDLPETLARFREHGTPIDSVDANAAPPSSRVVIHEPAVSHRVVSLQELRRARDRRGLGWSHAGAFAIGVAAAASFVLFSKVEGPGRPEREPGAGPLPSASASASSEPARVDIPPVATCAAECCAGTACGAAQGELKACASGRQCIACGDAPSGAAFRLRLGNLVPTPLLDGTSLSALDVCGRVAGSDWTCFPAFEEPAAEPRARALTQLVSTEDLASGVELELRPRGEKAVGKWRSSVRLGPTVLCRGLGAALSNEKGEHYGSLPVLLDDPYFVEIARAADVASLERRRSTIQLADVVPRLVETRAEAGEHFALVAGPFDQATAERLRWALEARAIPARTTLGGDHTGLPRPLP